MKKIIKNDFFKIILAGIIINLLCFVFGSIYSHASTVDTKLPHKVNNRLTYNFSDYADCYNNFWGNPVIMGSDLYVVDWTKNNILAWSVPDGQITTVHFMLPKNNNPDGSHYSISLNGYPYNTFNTANNHITITYDIDYWYHTIITERADGSLNAGGFNNTQNGMQVSFFASYTTPSFLNGGVYYWNSGENSAPVLYSNAVDIIEPGEPTEPDYPEEPEEPEPPEIPEPPVLPTINDLSDLASFLSDLFEWLIGVLGAWLSYLGAMIKYLLQSLIGTLKAGFDSIYQNFKNFFKPFLENIQNLIENIKDFVSDIKTLITTISETIQHFFEPFNFNTAQTQLNNSATITAIRGIITNIKTFAGIFDNTSEPDSLVFTLDFRNNSYFNFGLCTLDLNIIKPFRSFIRLIIGCILVFGLIVSIATSINSYIGGNSNKNNGE